MPVSVWKILTGVFHVIHSNCSSLLKADEVFKENLDKLGVVLK